MESLRTVSVVVTCFNYGKYLPECLDSLLNQTYPIEIIVVDDESTDNTKEVCAKYPVKYIWQKNKGLSGARNTGIKESTGEFLMMLDADDKLVPAAIAEHVNLMADDETIAQCSLMQFGKFYNVHTPQGATYESLLYGNTVFCNAMFSKKAWEKSRCGFDESEVMRLGLEDYLFWLDLTKQGCKVNTSDFIALRYRQHDNNMTNKTTHPNWPKILEYMRSIHPLLKAK